jgi:hypothetical protein
VGDKLVNAITKNFGLRAIRTCLRVTEHEGDDQTEDKLNAPYNAGLVISGAITLDREIVLRVKPRHGKIDTVALPFDTSPDLMTKRLQSHIIRAVTDLEASMSDPPVNLVDEAVRLEMFLKQVDWSGNQSAQFPDDVEFLRARVGLEAKVGQVMPMAALSSHDGQWAEKALTHFTVAESIRNSSEQYKDIIEHGWEDDYPLALLTDAQLNKKLQSGKLAASIYLKKYEDSVAERNITDDRRYMLATDVAAAFRAIYLIDNGEEAGKASIRFSCQALLHWKNWQELYEAWSKRVDPLIKKGMQSGSLLKLRPFQEGDGYKITLSAGKDPLKIVGPNPTIKMIADCEQF